MATRDHQSLIALAKNHSPWFHQIQLTKDFVTPGVDKTQSKLEVLDSIGLPRSCNGLRVLDIGAWDGFFSFEMERRGAEVVAVDHVEMEATGFGIARQIFGSHVEWRTCNVYDLDVKDLGEFDIVLCLGVIYHLRHILLGMDAIRSVIKSNGLLFVETAGIDNHLVVKGGRLDKLSDYGDVGESPLLQVYPRDELGNDYTNYFAPNKSGLDALLIASEFSPVQTIVPTTWPTRIYSCAKAVSNAQVAFYRDRDASILDKR